MILKGERLHLLYCKIRAAHTSIQIHQCTIHIHKYIETEKKTHANIYIGACIHMYMHTCIHIYLVEVKGVEQSNKGIGKLFMCPYGRILSLGCEVLEIAVY